MADFSSGVQIMRKAANDISRLNSIPNNPLLEGLSHENLLLYRVPSYGEHISLRKFMLCQKIQWIDTLEVAAMVNFIEGVLRAVHYLHQHNIYHLDLQPSNIIIKKTGFMKYTAQVGGFEFVKQKEKVFREEIGLNDLYRPPECYSNEVVDAAKADCWGLGIVALEVFTGGMLTIEADSKGSSDVRGAELIRVLKMLDPRYFASAMSAAGRAWTEGVDFDLERAHFLHDINDTEFVPLCWSLTRELLRPDPGRRCTPKQALDSIPMQPNIYLATDSYFRQRCPKRPFERKGKYVRA